MLAYVNSHGGWVATAWVKPGRVAATAESAVLMSRELSLSQNCMSALGDGSIPLPRSYNTRP